MKTNYVILTVFCLLLAIPYSMAQNWESVRNSTEYIWGEGYGASIEEADKHALADLISKIVVNVSSQSKSNLHSTTKNGEVTENNDFRNYIQSYSQATLTNTQRLIIHNEPDAHVGRWIKVSEVNKIFHQREIKIREMVKAALYAEEKGKADDALRNWYWALKLTESLQYPNQATFTDEQGRAYTLTVWIPQKMSEVFDNLKATAVRRNGQQVELNITYKGKPVNSVDYTYFDGQAWSNIYSARDGVGTLELASGNAPQLLQIKYEYAYTSQAQIDREVEQVLNVAPTTPMRKAYITISATGTSTPNTSDDIKLTQVKTTDASPTPQGFSSTDPSIMKAPTQIEKSEHFNKVLNLVAQAICRHTTQGLQPYFTPEGLDIYTRLIQYGRARIVGQPEYTLYQDGENVTCRGLKMAFSFQNGARKSFVEEVVFTFNKDKKICNIAFGLGQTAEKDILYKGSWNEATRKAIMNFLENYKTAYALKRLDYIDQIFDDDAVIIVGNVLKKVVMTRSNEHGVSFKNSTIIRRNRYTKDQYLQNLKRCFASNEYVNIRFQNNDVRKMGRGDETYAIQLAQDYYSSTYGDHGYLFLMVDINDPTHPIIKVRTWQPEPDPDFGLYGPEDFK